MYRDMLDRAVRALKSGKVPDFDLTSEHEAEIELHVAALIPADYLADVNARLTLYKRISSAADEDALRDLQVEMVDRFGLLPDQVKNLFAITEIKLLATPLGIRKLELGANGGRVLFNAKPNIDPMTVIRMIQTLPKVYALDGQDKLKIKLQLEGASERIRLAREIIVALAKRTAA